MSEKERNEERGAQPKSATGMFGAKPMMKPLASMKPPTQGPKGGAGDSGASKR